MCRQSVDAPWRTIRALVNAANDMAIAAMATQIALLDGGGEYSSTPSKFPSAGTRFRQPPLPEFPVWDRDGRRRTSVSRGSWTVVGINFYTLTLFIPIRDASNPLPPELVPVTSA